MKINTWILRESCLIYDYISLTRYNVLKDDYSALL